MIEVVFESESSKTIGAIEQWSSGVVLGVSGIDSLGERFIADFAHSAMSCADTFERIGKTFYDTGVIPVPNKLFTVTGNITVSFGNHTIIIPVTTATRPENYDCDCKSDYDNDLAMISKLRSDSLNASNIYPIGAIYISTNSVNPSTIFGGTWERIQDKFILAAGTTYGAGTSGGSAAHKHVTPVGVSGKVFAAININGMVSGGQGRQYVNVTGSSGTMPGNVSLGYTSNESSLPPYLAVYVWERTA